MNDLQVALELYTVRDETRRDFAGTLQRVSQIGYTGVEFAGYGNLTSGEMSALLAETKLKAVSTHLGLDGLENQQLSASLRYCKDIGCSLIVLPSLPKEWRTQEGIKVLAPRLNARIMALPLAIITMILNSLKLMVSISLITYFKLLTPPS